MNIGRQKRQREFLLRLFGVLSGCACVFMISSFTLPQAAIAAEAFELGPRAGAFEYGKQDFALKRYYSAKARFMTAISQNPSNQKAYLYLGLCLEATKEWEDAQSTYRACFAVDPFSEDGKLAKKLSMELSGYLESRGNRAVDTPEDVYKAGLRIQRQALELQERKLRESRAFINNNRSRGRSRGYNYTPNDLVQRPRQDDVSNMDFIRNAHDIYDGQTQEARARGYGVKNAQNVQDSANALIERLGRKTKRSPALRATGTDLYVQYYRSKNDEDDIPPPADPQLELRARQMKFSESSPPVPSTGARATSKSVSGEIEPVPLRSRRGTYLPETDPAATEAGPGVVTYE